MPARPIVTSGAIASVAIAVGLNAASASSSQQPEEMMEMSPEQLVEMMRASAAPDDHHTFIDRFAGEWDCTLNFWWEPGGEPEVSTGIARSTWDLGGRFLRTEFEGSFGVGEMSIPINGVGYMGYDRLQNQFFTTWMDTMTTSMTMLTGDGDIDKGTIAVGGETHSFMGPSRMKNVYELTDDGFTLTFYEPNPMNPDGELMKTGYISYTRR